MYKNRDIERGVVDALRVFRVVSLTGARQVGKTTLLRRLCSRLGMGYATLDDPLVRGAVEADVDAWLDAQGVPLAIDEAQLAPCLFPALKRRVDDNGRPGSYLITGSALWLSMKKIGESLAGRTAIFEMWPFRGCEYLEKSWDWNTLMCLEFDPGTIVVPSATLGDLRDRIMSGGYPEPACMINGQDRRTWFESYLRTYLQRDVLDLAHIEHLAEFTRLIRLLALQTGGMANQSALSRDLGLPQPTVRRYLAWLRTTYQCHELQPYSINTGKRMVKTPKVYWSDTGMATSLAGWATWDDMERAQRCGALIENWVLNDLRAWMASATGGADLFFWRSHDGGEVDALIEKDGFITGIEVKAGYRIDERDLKGLSECRTALGKRWRRGIVLYGGNEVRALGHDVYAVPLVCLLGGEIREKC